MLVEKARALARGRRRRREAEDIFRVYGMGGWIGCLGGGSWGDWDGEVCGGDALDWGAKWWLFEVAFVRDFFGDRGIT